MSQLMALRRMRLLAHIYVALTITVVLMKNGGDECSPPTITTSLESSVSRI